METDNLFYFNSLEGWACGILICETASLRPVCTEGHTPDHHLCIAPLAVADTLGGSRPIYSKSPSLSSEDAERERAFAIAERKSDRKCRPEPQGESPESLFITVPWGATAHDFVGLQPPPTMPGNRSISMGPLFSERPSGLPKQMQATAPRQSSETHPRLCFSNSRNEWPALSFSERIGSPCRGQRIAKSASFHKSVCSCCGA